MEISKRNRRRDFFYYYIAVSLSLVIPPYRAATFPYPDLQFSDLTSPQCFGIPVEVDMSARGAARFYAKFLEYKNEVHEELDSSLPRYFSIALFDWDRFDNFESRMIKHQAQTAIPIQHPMQALFHSNVPPVQLKRLTPTQELAIPKF